MGDDVGTLRKRIVYLLLVEPTWLAHVNVGKLEVEVWIDVTENLMIGVDNLLQLDEDEEVEGIDVLLDEPLHLEKGWQQVPFILERLAEAAQLIAAWPYLGSVDWIGDVFSLVKWFQ